jgi:HPr Serine kinase C-terminal domain
MELSLLCHSPFEREILDLFGDRMQKERRIKKPSALASMKNHNPIYQCVVPVIGQPCLLHTNSRKLQTIVSSFFRNPMPSPDFHKPIASLHLYVEESNGNDHISISELRDMLPYFRGFGPFVFATYSERDKMTFNLLDREVSGIFSAATVENEELWKRVILPVLVGVMTSSLGTVAVHSACLVYHGQGILISGYSGVGKSTLAVALARRGLSLLSDDWTYVSSRNGNLEVWGLPVPVKLLPDTVRFFPELAKLSSAPSLNGELSFEVHPDDFFGCSRSLHCVPRCFLLLERSDEPLTTFQPVSSEEISSYLADGLERLPETLDHLRQRQLSLLHGLHSCKLFRLRFHGTPDSVAEQILEFCQSNLKGDLDD